jgi:hypothetical protein
MRVFQSKSGLVMAGEAMMRLQIALEVAGQRTALMAEGSRLSGVLSEVKDGYDDAEEKVVS